MTDQGNSGQRDTSKELWVVGCVVKCKSLKSKNGIVGKGEAIYLVHHSVKEMREKLYLPVQYGEFQIGVF